MPSPLGLVVHCTGIEIEGQLEKSGVGRGWGSRFVVVYVDDQKEWKSSKRSSGSPLLWQQDYRFEFRPSSRITIQLFRRGILPTRQKLGRFSGNLIELLVNDTAFDMADEAGNRLSSIKIKIRLALISQPPQDILRKVDAAISHLDDSVLSQISNAVSASPSAIVGSYTPSDYINTCIPSLGQAFASTVKIARKLGHAHPVLKVSCTVLLSMYEAFKNERLPDESIRALAESLREMVYVAAECLDLPVSGGTENLAETIGHISLQVASLIDEYIKLPFAVRGSSDALSSNSMKERARLLQTRCRDITEKLGIRVNLDGIHPNVLQIYKTLRLERTLDWLKAPDPSKTYNNARERHADGTCTWFLTGKEFSGWKEGGRSLLWVNGIPGCGKTILCSSVIEDISRHCADNTSSAVAYFFFNSEDAQDDLRRYGDLLRCLTKQLLLQCKVIPHCLEQPLGSSQPSDQSLLEALELLLVQFKDVYLLIDSLDECTERESVLTWLQHILRCEAFEHRIHILVSSRDELGIRQSLESLDVVQVCMQSKSVDDDIRSYVDRTLQTARHMQIWNDTTKEEIRKHVLEISKGMFRLAALQLEGLRSCRNIDELKLRLGQLPPKLYETYDHILSKLEPPHRQSALRVLQWLVDSARPPRLIELPEFVAVDFEAKPYPRFCEDMRYNLEGILVICSNLIIVTAEGNIQPVHPSVKEYILTSTSLQKFGFTTNEESIHSLIAQTCLAYLLQFETPEILTEDTLDNFPLAQYAADHWVSHAHAATGDGRTDPLNTLTYTLFTGNDAPFVAWVRLNDLDRPGSKRDMKRAPIGSRLYYACLAGLQDLSSTLLDAGEDPNAKGFDNCTVLQVASRNGQYRTVQHLLEKGAVVYAPFGGQHGSAFRAASSEGYKEIVQLLLEKGARARVNAESTKYGTALQAAALEGHGKIVMLLLENGAEVNTPQEPRGSALQAAASRGHESIVRLLLEKGAEVNKQSQEYGDALQAASTGGHEDIVRLLLENGADVNARGVGPYKSALQAASRGKHQAIAELLLEKGADPVDHDAEGTD